MPCGGRDGVRAAGSQIHVHSLVSVPDYPCANSLVPRLFTAVSFRGGLILSWCGACGLLTKSVCVRKKYSMSKLMSKLEACLLVGAIIVHQLIMYL